MRASLLAGLTIQWKVTKKFSAKHFCPPVKISCPSAGNVNETPGHVELI